METTSESKDQELAESLLRFFVDEKRYECFAACLYICYELIRPDVVMELSWRHQLSNYAMPYQIQTLREYDTKVKFALALALVLLLLCSCSCCCLHCRQLPLTN